MKEKPRRGGLGNKGNPLAIKQSIAEAVRDMQRTTHDLEKIQRNKEELLADLADLRIREKEAEENDSSEEARTLIKKNILNVQKKISEVNGIIPDVSLSDDQKKIQKIINEWNTAKKEKRSALAIRAKAEDELAKDPGNMKAMGKANRASAAILSNTQEMEKAFHEAEIIKGKFTHDPVLDESINIHTGEKELKEKPAPQKSAAKNQDLKKEDEEVHDEGIFYTHKQSIADQEKFRRAHSSAQKVLSHEEKGSEGATPQIPLKKKAIGISKKIAERDSKKLIIPPQREEKGEYDYAEATKNLLLQMNRVLAKNKKTAGSSPDDKKNIPVFTLKPAESHLLLNDKDHIPKSGFTSLKDTFRGSITRREREQKKKETGISSLAERMLSHHLDILFGKSGFLGFGAQKGTASPHWEDPIDGFAKKTVEDIFAKRLPKETRQNAAQKTSQYFGIKNDEATHKMKKYLSQAFEQTKMSPLPKEKAKDYLLRVITTIFDNPKNKK